MKFTYSATVTTHTHNPPPPPTQESQKVLELSNAIRKEVATRVAAGLEEAEKGNCSESSSSSISTEKHSTDGTDSLETLLRQMLIMAKLLNADGQAVGNKASAVRVGLCV